MKQVLFGEKGAIDEPPSADASCVDEKLPPQLFATTLHVINSAISKIAVASSMERVYCGLSIQESSTVKVPLHGLTSGGAPRVAPPLHCASRLVHLRESVD